MKSGNLFFMVLPWVLIAVALTLYFTGRLSLADERMHSAEILTKVESMGKLELVKYHVKDVVEQKLVREWLPDPSAILIVSGEIVGCIDLTKVSAKDVKIRKDTLFIKLPPAEICYARINHQDSKVYSTEYAFWDEAHLVDEAYKQAEKQLLNAGRSSEILAQTRQNAGLILNPFFRSFGYKDVIISF